MTHFCISIVALQSFLLTSQSLCVKEMVVPDYPTLAIWAKIQGSVPVEVEIGSGGRVASAKALAGHRLLAVEAEKNALTWTFAPLDQGLKFPIRYKVTYDFKLEGEPLDHFGTPKVRFHLPDRVEISAHPRQVEASRDP